MNGKLIKRFVIAGAPVGTEPATGEVFRFHDEYKGDRSEEWIVVLNLANTELRRYNVRHVSVIEWSCA